MLILHINGLGYSATAKYYAIKNSEETEQYLNHLVLGKRLLHCTNAVLAIENKTALDIFGEPDNVKLNSCMTLFTQLPNSSPVFNYVTDVTQSLSFATQHKPVELP